MLSNSDCQLFTDILKYELIEATGCTEPIAIAMVGAKAAQLTQEEALKIDIYCSGNMIKNVKGVHVPNSGGLKGIDVAILLGYIGGKADTGLQVIADVTDEHRKQVRETIKKNIVTIHLAKEVPSLYIKADVITKNHKCVVEVQNTHTNFTKIIIDEKVIVDSAEIITAHEMDKSKLTVKAILEYGESVNVEDIKEVIKRQIEDNCAISQEGLKGDYGAQVGKTLLSLNDNSVEIRARAAAAAGSDARMNGCAMPVVINSGSGNQGMTLTLPVVEYAKEMQVGEEKLYRALAIANLIAIHQKKYIGSLSAYCGAVSAATGAACAICWLQGGSYDQIMGTIVNSILTIGGMVCDGAKASCAGKISMSVENSLTAMKLSMNGHVYEPGEGMAKDDPEETIRAVGRMAAKGMHATDEEILNIMIED